MLRVFIRGGIKIIYHHIGLAFANTMAPPSHVIEKPLGSEEGGDVSLTDTVGRVMDM